MKRHDEYRHLSVDELADDQLVFDLRQIKITIECGTSRDYEQQLRERLKAIYAEMARRQALVAATVARVEQQNHEASKIEKLWALICAAKDDKRAIDAMATDERFVSALESAREILKYKGNKDADPIPIDIGPAQDIADALVDMEGDLAQARGFLVAMTRAAEKWRAIARGEKS